MNILRNAMRAVVVSVCLLAAVGAARAGIILDGANDADYIALAAESQFDPVGVVRRLGSTVDSSGILIAPNWVLTAAHTIPSGNPNPADTWTFGGEVRHIAQTIRNPGFTGNIANGFDVALHRLDAPITTIEPAQLYTGTAASLLGQTLTYVGFGQTGTGSVGVTAPAGTKRAGNNVADQLGFTLNPGPNQSIWSNQLLFADMDAQGGPWGNPLGGTNPVNLEMLIAVGDSGGGLFVEDNGQYFVAGVHSVIFNFDPAADLGFGDVMGSTTIAAVLPWILDNITPDPIIGDLDGDGFVGIADLNIVLSLWNFDVVPGDLSLGDPSGDGFVGIADLNIILGNWNVGTSPLAGDINGLVPEPTTLALLAFAAATTLVRRQTTAH